uniref:Uncharacterized protein n=1 Tax=Lymantria dispar multicapsid nuclear polyhedrosis virus TaxID=10449 RepID=A0A140HQZ8_NPVLD|nr:hypothetical protein [Lymantria dispar multiple nucleopolyhedrovirus]QDE14981.1 hypothetical protein LdMNPV-J2_00125 [Lymantria dispar multiple nucleopolyhedrovirus]
MPAKRPASVYKPTAVRSRAPTTIRKWLVTPPRKVQSETARSVGGIASAANKITVH